MYSKINKQNLLIQYVEKMLHILFAPFDLKLFTELSCITEALTSSEGLDRDDSLSLDSGTIGFRTFHTWTANKNSFLNASDGVIFKNEKRI